MTSSGPGGRDEGMEAAAESIRRVSEAAAKALNSSGALDALQQMAAEVARANALNAMPLMQGLIDHAVDVLGRQSAQIVQLGLAVERDTALPITVLGGRVLEGEVVLSGTAHIEAAGRVSTEVSGLSAVDWFNLWAAIYGTVMSSLTAERGEVVDSTLAATAMLISIAIIRLLRRG